MKACTDCKNTKDFKEFSKSKPTPDGLAYTCKDCDSIRNKEYRSKNRKTLNEKSNSYYRKNKEKILKENKQYYQDNKIKRKAQISERYQKKKKEILAYGKEWSKNNPEKMKISRKRAYEKKRKEDPIFLVLNSLRSRLYSFITTPETGKTSFIRQAIGCSKEQLKNHLEIQFQESMTWDNYGKWHIDHIHPLSQANSVEELIELNHYKNLQPLWAIDNIKKSNKVNNKITRRNINEINK